VMLSIINVELDPIKILSIIRIHIISFKGMGVDKF